MDRRLFMLTSGSMALAQNAALAQHQSAPWPSRTVKAIVPVAVGTATDITARIFGEKLSQRWGQPFIVENKPGADGLIALGSFVAGRDDHTLLFSFSTAVSLNPLIHSPLPYDPEVDLAPIATTSEVLFGISTNVKHQISSMLELNVLAQSQPGKLNWAAAPGLPRFVLERHWRDNRLDLTYVGYNQTNAAVTDLGEGRIDIIIAALNTLWPVIEAGKVRVLAVAAADRSAILPDVPSAPEAGFPDLAVPAVGCIYGWRGMPDALRLRLALDIDAVAQEQAVVSQLGKVGQLVRRSTPDSLAKLLREQKVALIPLASVMVEKK